MLLNQARNSRTCLFVAAADPAIHPEDPKPSVAAQRIAYDVQQIDRAFSTTYAPASASQSSQALIANAQARWQNSVAGLQDACVQAGIVGNLDSNRTQMSALVSASQSATGALQATQAGNQIVALQAGQLADLTAAVAAQGGRSPSRPHNASPLRTAREQIRRFLTPGQGYQATDIRMFH